jgi:hypothetical protein
MKKALCARSKRFGKLVLPAIPIQSVQIGDNSILCDKITGAGRSVVWMAKIIWEGLKMPRPGRLPAHFPVGAKYVLEARGPLVLRHVELPGGRRIRLEPRKASACVRAKWQQIGVVPDPSAIAALSVNTSPSSESDFQAHRKEGVFEPVILLVMGNAYDRALQSFAKAPPRLVREQIASNILALTRRGMSDPVELYRASLDVANF